MHPVGMHPVIPVDPDPSARGDACDDRCRSRSGHAGSGASGERRVRAPRVVASVHTLLLPPPLVLLVQLLVRRHHGNARDRRYRQRRSASACLCWRRGGSACGDVPKPGTQRRCALCWCGMQERRAEGGSGTQAPAVA
eukprot:351140-Chlamydomonas_euryale.AAC.24